MERSNHKPLGLGKWQRMRKRENAHSSAAFPPVYACVCLCSQLSVCFQTRRYVCALCLLCEYSSVAGVWSLWQLHYGLCAQGDSTIQGKERRGQRCGTGQVYCWAGPCQSNRWRREGVGGQLLSPLMSLHFFHQLSIYRTVQHFYSSPHSHPHRVWGHLVSCRWFPGVVCNS